MRSLPAWGLLSASLLGACFPTYSFDLPPEDPSVEGQGGSSGEGGAAGISGLPGGAAGGEGPAAGGAGDPGAAGQGDAGSGANPNGILDPFDGGGALGAGWSGDLGSFAVNGGALEVKGSGVVTWNQPFDAAQEAFFSLVAPPVGGSVGLVLKSQSGKCNRIEVLYSPGAVLVRWCKNNKVGQPGVLEGVVLAPGDTLRARYTEEERVQVYRNEELLGNVLVADWDGKQKGGTVGVIAEGISGAILDNFGGK